MSAAGQPRQLVFDLPLREATGIGDFLVSSSNEAAVALVDRWPDWPHPSAVLTGPAASGKSHLGAVWQARSAAVTVAGSALSEATVATFRDDAVRALLVEDIDRGIADERILFHLLNHARETSRFILVTSRLAPGDLDVTLPDLRSRLRALPVAAIAGPDEALLGAVLVKLFADRQLVVDPAIVSYLVRHMDRSLEIARAVALAIDALALTRQRKITRALAAEALASLSQDAPDE
jgi:chromosomal replication initiation ATPase DnaA